MNGYIGMLILKLKLGWRDGRSSPNPGRRRTTAARVMAADIDLGLRSVTRGCCGARWRISSEMLSSGEGGCRIEPQCQGTGTGSGCWAEEERQARLGSTGGRPSRRGSRHLPEFDLGIPNKGGGDGGPVEVILPLPPSEVAIETDFRWLSLAMSLNSFCIEEEEDQDRRPP